MTAASLPARSNVLDMYDDERCPNMLRHDTLGEIGSGLWRSPFQMLSKPPWGPRWDYASLCGAKSPKGFRNLWILGGDIGKPMNDIWRSIDGGVTWKMTATGPRWGPRSRLAVCGGATTPSKDGLDRPIGIIYVVGGQSSAGFFDDIWASDTAGSTWHCMNNRTPFGPRADMACVVVPSDPLHLLVGGGISSDLHRDLWLSYDAGETFSEVKQHGIPTGFSLLQCPPCIICASQSQFGLALWSLTISTNNVSSPEATLYALGEDHIEAQSENLLNQVPQPPSVCIDLELRLALAWDPHLSCIVAYPLQDCEWAKPFPLDGMRIIGKQVHVHCDMDGRFENLQRGKIWAMSTTKDSSEVFSTDDTRLAAQHHFVLLVGLRLSAHVPWELWVDRVCACIFPARRRGVQRFVLGLAFNSVWKVVHKPRVAVRDAPSSSGNIVGAAPYGAEVKPLESSGPWLRVEGCFSGWMLQDGSSLGLGKLMERII